MPRAAKDIRASLKKKGFEESKGDHKFYHLRVDGRKTGIKTKVSHGHNDVPDNLIGVMARQRMINKSQFLELIDCPLSFEDYLVILRDNGHPI